MQLFLLALKQQFLTWKEYRVDALAGVFGALIEAVISIALYGVIFSSVTQLGPWTFWDVLLLLGFAKVAFGVADTFSEGLWSAGTYARDGTLAEYQLRPLDPLVQLLLERVQFERLTNVVIGVFLIIAAQPHINFTLHGVTFVVLALLVLAGVVIYLALLVVGAALSIASGNAEIMGVVWNFSSFANYPAFIFGRVGHGLLTTLLPLGVVGYVPAAVASGATTPLSSLVGSSIAGTVVFALLALWLWRSALGRYEGTGS